MRKKFLLATLLLMFKVGVFAQTGAPVDMADTMRSNGKIYVVLAVVLTIFAGMIIYLIRLDRKITRLEKNNSPFHSNH